MDEPPHVESFESTENDNQQDGEHVFQDAQTMEVDADPVDDSINELEIPEVDQSAIVETDESNVKKNEPEDESTPSEQIENNNISSMDQDDADSTVVSDLDKTNASLDEASSLNFTEKSINFSQINADENDDSNDAFNALKETEVDVFSTKEEVIEKTSLEEEQSEKDEEPAQDSESIQDQVFDSLLNPDEKSENEDKEMVGEKETENGEKSPEDDNILDTVEADLESTSTDKNEMPVDEITDATPTSDETQLDKVVEEHGDDDIGTTTEMEGVDENLCLLGDAEREITDADKEKAMQAAEETAVDEQPDESMAIDTEIPTEDNEEESLEIADKDAQEDQAESEEQTEASAAMSATPLKSNEIREICEELTEQTCLNCENSAKCHFQLLEDDDVKYLCTYNCVVEHREDNPDKYIIIQKKVYIYQVPDAENSCEKCTETKMCKYRYRISTTETPKPKETPKDAATTTDDGPEEIPESEPAVEETPVVVVSYKYLCDSKCMDDFINKNTDKYIVKRKVYVIDEIAITEDEFDCIECSDKKPCKYKFARHDETSESYVCNEDCLNLLLKEQPDNFRVKRRSVRVRDLPKRVVGPPPTRSAEDPEMAKIVARTDAEQEAARVDRDASFVRRCAQCLTAVTFTAKSCQWETMDFCDEKCLGLYQNLIGANCTTCHSSVTMPSLGKYCVRFGFDVKQFCCSVCLDVYKKGLKQCALCQRDLSSDEELILAKVGDKGQFKDFCNQVCLKRYEDIINPKKKPPAHVCSVCNNEKPAKIEVNLESGLHRFCSNPCFSAFKFVNNVFPDQCDMCLKYFERQCADAFTIYRGDITKMFCTKICMNTFIVTSREIWQCNWCKVSKYNYDMIVRNFGKTRMCSLNCLTLFEVSVNALSRKRLKCDHCKTLKQPQYHLTMTDASIRNFCTYQCVLGFQSQFSKKLQDGQESVMDGVVPAGTAKRIKPPARVPVNIARPPMTNVPIISRIQSLSSSGRRGRPPRVRSPIPVPELTVQLEPLGDLPARVKLSGGSGPSSYTAIPTSPPRAPSPEIRIESKTQVVTIPPLPIQMENKSTMCKSIMLNKGISCRVSTKTAECQTDDYLEQKYIIPVPIPIFIPQPMYMYNMPVPVPVPCPLPIPIPIFIPTTRNSSQGIMKEIKKIQEKMPTDPFEAELLMMAEMVAGDKKREETDSDSDAANDIEYGDGIENNSSFNEDLVQMAFKMASGNDFDDPPVDLENEMTANTISQNTHPYGTEDMDPQSLHHHQLLLLQQQREAAAAAAAIQAGRGRKRINTPKQQTNNNNNNNRNTANKRIKRELDVLPSQDISREPAEKPDANMCLKYTFGVNAWKQWVATKNADLEKSSMRRKPFKSEILQLTADELNYSLCLFVKEVRKPNGSEYAPDTIYYLVLGIQQYLYENGRIDNIFTDRYYDPFTDCLDEVAKKFSVLYNDSQYIVTRVEEEHLWECKQLGAHSPHVLLSTLMFFNTKHFNLVTVDEHMELSFSHIMKHWKRNPNQPGAAKMPGSRNVLLRFYPPQSSLEANSRKKKVYEQQENEENPLRCPVKLYEFYLSKCPESVKTRNDVFYLQPERSCVPDSPVWYSTQPLSRDALSKMLHRVKMVKEINIALLTS